MTGIWEAQFVRDAHDAYLIDLNPRPYGSLGLAVAAGLNLPGIWADVVLGREPIVTDYRIGRRYRAEMRELGFLTEALAARDVRSVSAALLPRRRTTHAVLSLRDPAPTVFLLDRMAARLRRR
jgi:predicted ATP-grasp superfamily ATP-dependent carboligase